MTASNGSKPADASTPTGAELPAGAMLADLRRQADCLRTLARRRDDFMALGRERFAKCERIVAFGSGDGWFAARAASDYARNKLGLPFEAASSLETLAYTTTRIEGMDAAAIAISMSGSADRTNEAAETLRANGAPVLALTNGAGGELARIADGKISLDVPDLAPFLTGTAKYTATLLGLIMLLDGAAGASGDDWLRQLETLPAMLKAVEVFARDFVATLDRPPTGVRILSAGSNQATADYGQAKFVKLLPMPIWSDEVEEFAHRSFWSCPATDLVIYLATNRAVARCASASAAALASMGMTTVAIDMPDCPVTTASARFTLPATEEAQSVLLAAIPLQFIAYFLAEAFGADPNQSQDIGDPARFHAAQLLSRRGELGVAAG